MSESIKALKEASDEAQRIILDAPIWISLYAAYRHDGVIDPAEKTEAIKQANFRTFTSPNELHDYYEVIDHDFEEKFEAYNSELPEDEEERYAFIENKMNASKDAIAALPNERFSHLLLKDLDEYYRRVFKANSNPFQFFAFPVISNSLNKKK